MQWAVLTGGDSEAVAALLPARLAKPNRLLMSATDSVVQRFGPSAACTASINVPLPQLGLPTNQTDFSNRWSVVRHNPPNSSRYRRTCSSIRSPHLPQAGEVASGL